MRRWLLCAAVVLFLAGCQTAPHRGLPGKAESPDQVVSAIGSMTEGLTNTSVSKEDLKRLAVDVQKNPETRSAVTAVNSAFDIQAASVRYCPVDGKRFSSRLEECPVHHVKLLNVDD